MSKDNTVPGFAASSNGRLLTLDPIREEGDLTVKVREVETRLPVGFTMSWLSHRDKNVTLEVLTSTSVWMCIAIKEADKTYDYVVNGNDIANKVMDYHRTAHPAPKRKRNAKVSR